MDTRGSSYTKSVARTADSRRALNLCVNRCLTVLRLDWSILHSERSSLLNKPSPELVNGGLMLHPFQHQFVQASRLSKLLEERLHLTVRSANDWVQNIGRVSNTRRPSRSVNCHSEKSSVNLSNAGKPKPFRPPHGHRSSPLSLNNVVDLEKHSSQNSFPGQGSDR